MNWIGPVFKLLIEGGVIVSEMGKNKPGGERLLYRSELKPSSMPRWLYTKALCKVPILFIEASNDHTCMVMGEPNVSFNFFFYKTHLL